MDEYYCPLIGINVDETICYDIQMVTGNMINKVILNDYSIDINVSLVTEDRAAEFCESCPFNQLKQPAPSKATE